MFTFNLLGLRIFFCIERLQSATSVETLKKNEIFLDWIELYTFYVSAEIYVSANKESKRPKSLLFYHRLKRLKSWYAMILRFEFLKESL